MAPLTVEDLLPLEVYAPRRREFFDSHRRYIDRYRRVRIGSRLTLVFENRQTLWFRVQEVVRVARLSERREVEQELCLYNRLLPGGDLLQAALLLDAPDREREGEWEQWRELRGEHLRLVLGDEELQARLLTSRAENRSSATAHWVQFTFDDHFRELLGDFGRTATFRFDDGEHRHHAPLGDDLRHSLLEDLRAA